VLSGWRASGPCSTGDKEPSAGHERHPVEGFRCNAATQLDVTALKGIEGPRTAAQFARLPKGTTVDDPEDPAELAIVRMSAEIDITNAAHVGDELAAALTPGVVAIIADMTATTFCGSSAITMLLGPTCRPPANDAELPLVTLSGPVLRALAIVAADCSLPIYPSVAAALIPPG
jgi:anti-anti-sigma factor